MEVIKISPRGYCHGVVTALNKVVDAIADENTKQPIYILGQIVHNQNITKAFDEKGVITLTGKNRQEILNQVDEGTVIITAHGIDYHLIKQAEDRGLNVIDATCSDVYKTHHLISDKIDEGYEVIYIGKKNHPEPEGVIGINPQKIHLVETIDDINQLNLNTDKLFCTNQTTMSIWDVEDLINQIKAKYPQVEVENEICLATQQRQEAVVELAKNSDLCIVVGDEKSNNSKRLVQVSQEIAHTKAILISDIEELDINYLLADDVNVVSVTSGASTPTMITNQVIEFVQQFQKDDPSTHKLPEKMTLSRIIPRIRKK